MTLLQRRRLLSSSSSVVDSYSSLVASTKGFSNAAVTMLQKDRRDSTGAAMPLVTETWLQEPFGWPPKVCVPFLYAQLICVLFSFCALVCIMIHMLAVMIQRA